MWGFWNFMWFVDFASYGPDSWRNLIILFQQKNMFILGCVRIFIDIYTGLLLSNNDGGKMPKIKTCEFCGKVLYCAECGARHTPDLKRKKKEVCSVRGCMEERKTKGLCTKHYMRQYMAKRRAESSG